MTDSDRKTLLEIYGVMDSGRIYDAKLLLEEFLGIVKTNPKES